MNDEQKTLKQYYETQKYWRCIFRDPSREIKRVAVRIAMRPFDEHAALALELQKEPETIVQEIGKALGQIANGARCSGKPRGVEYERRLQQGARFGDRKADTSAPPRVGPYTRRQRPTNKDIADTNFRRSTDWPKMLALLKARTGKTLKVISAEVKINYHSIRDYSQNKSNPSGDNAQTLIIYAGQHGVERVKAPDVEGY